jgi:hypothetical protein
MGSKILRLQSPKMRHHDREAEDAVEGEPFMRAVEGLEESTRHHAELVRKCWGEGIF